MISAFDRISNRVALRYYAFAVAMGIATTALLATYKYYNGVGMNAYTHRLVSWQDGFIRRGLVGTIYQITGSNPVNPDIVWLEGVLTVSVFSILFFILLKKSITGSNLDKWAVFIFLMASPLIIKNFLQNIAYFDVIGASVAVITALSKPNYKTIIFIFIACAILLLIHHIHATLYIPNILSIFIIKCAGESNEKSMIGIIAVVTAFLILLFFMILNSTPTIDADLFLEKLQDRSSRALNQSATRMWYSTIFLEIAATQSTMLKQALRIPVYLAVFAAHAPIIILAARCMRTASKERPGDYIYFIISIIVVTICYIVTFNIAFDYSRFLGDYSFCLTIIVITYLGKNGSFDISDKWHPCQRWVITCAIIVSMLPRLGTTIPF